MTLGPLAVARYAPVIDAPPSIADLVHRLNAATGLFTDSGGTTPATADGDRIGRWTDQSVSGKNATQSTSGSRPTLKTGIMNGQAVVRGDGSAHYLDFTKHVLTNYTLFIAMRLVSVQSGYRLAYGTDTSCYVRMPTQWGTYNGANANTTLTTGVNYLLVMSGNSSGGTYYLNGSSDGTWTNSVNTAAGYVFSDPGGSQYANIDIGWIDLYSRVLNSTERGDLTAYLKTRFGVS